MKSQIILTGATGGIGSQILKRLVDGEDMICCLSRTIGNSEMQYTTIQADFSKVDFSYHKRLNHWIKANELCKEIVLILAASSIKPIEGIGKLGGGITGEHYHKCVITGEISG